MVWTNGLNILNADDQRLWMSTELASCQVLVIRRWVIRIVRGEAHSKHLDNGATKKRPSDMFALNFAQLYTADSPASFMLQKSLNENCRPQAEACYFLLLIRKFLDREGTLWLWLQVSMNKLRKSSLLWRFDMHSRLTDVLSDKMTFLTITKQRNVPSVQHSHQS